MKDNSIRRAVREGRAALGTGLKEFASRGSAETEAQIEEYWQLGCKVLNLPGTDRPRALPVKINWSADAVSALFFLKKAIPACSHPAPGKACPNTVLFRTSDHTRFNP